MKYAPWHSALVAEVFAAGPSVSLAAVARKVGQTEKACEKVLRSEWGQGQLALYAGAMRKKLVEQKVRPLEELTAWGHEAARGLVAALWLATERENVREMRESATAILAHLGMGPVKRSEKTVTHGIARITDPQVLQRIIDEEDFDPALLDDPTTH
jgi:hypothetical protein